MKDIIPTDDQESRDILISADGNGHLSLLVMHQAMGNLQLSSKEVATNIPKQRLTVEYRPYITSMYDYIETEGLRGRQYTVREQATLCLANLDKLYYDRFNEQADHIIGKNPHNVPSDLTHGCIAITFRQWADDY